jgi:hypothetical protein
VRTVCGTPPPVQEVRAEGGKRRSCAPRVMTAVHEQTVVNLAHSARNTDQ